MKIEVNLLIQFKHYLPRSESEGRVRFLEIDEPATVKDVLNKLDIPLDLPKVIMINKRQASTDDAIAPFDRLTVFPPVGGG